MYCYAASSRYGNAHSQTLDRLTLSIAFRNGIARRDIAWMLASDSSYVRRIRFNTIKHQVMLYIQKTIRSVARKEQA